MCTQQTDLTGLAPPPHTHTPHLLLATHRPVKQAHLHFHKNLLSTQADNGQHLPSYFRFLFLAVGISIPSRISQ